jgi:hypothetical protein
MVHARSLFALALGLSPAAALADGDYLGTLKPPPQSSLSPTGIYYSFKASSALESLPTFGMDSGNRFRLSYKPSRYFAVEGQYVDFANNPSDFFSSPGNLASPFRSTGFGVDTIAMLPLWRFSFYGRMGAYRGDARGFGYGSNSLLPSDPFIRSTRLRYGMGVRYDFTKSLGVRAELERHSPMSSPFSTDADGLDQQLSVGLSWKF